MATGDAVLEEVRAQEEGAFARVDIDEDAVRELIRWGGIEANRARTMERRGERILRGYSPTREG